MTSILYKGVSFDLPDIAGLDVFLVFGVRKSGSSILNSVVEALANHVGMPYLDVAGELFRSGIPVGDWQSDAEILQLLRRGNVYGGFRDVPYAFTRAPNWAEFRKLLLVRDPRDALVSEYFSNAYSHEVPETGASREVMLDLRERANQVDIDTFVVERARSMVETLSQYLLVRDSENALVMKYEEFIPNKRESISQILDHFRWDVPDHVIAHVLEWADVLPTDEDPARFIRKVTPGDHREKLTPGTIADLNDLLGPVMTAYGYDID